MLAKTIRFEPSNVYKTLQQALLLHAKVFKNVKKTRVSNILCNFVESRILNSQHAKHE